MALEDEINYCGYRSEMGTRMRSRPQNFCESVTIASTLSVSGPTTMSEAVASNVTVTGPSITVGGMTFVPRMVMTLEGPVMVLAVGAGLAG